MNTSFIFGVFTVLFQELSLCFETLLLYTHQLVAELLIMESFGKLVRQEHLQELEQLQRAKIAGPMVVMPIAGQKKAP